MKIFKALSFVLGITSLSVLAGDYRFQSVKATGSGCPVGTGSITFSPDNKQASLIFDEYMVQAPGPEGQLLESKSCSIKVTAKLPAGVGLKGLTISADLRGGVFVESGAEAGLTVSSLAPSRSLASNQYGLPLGALAFTKKKWAPGDGVIIDDPQWEVGLNRFVKAPRECSKSEQLVTFTLHTNAYAKINNPEDPNAFALLSVESSDIAGALKLSMNSYACANFQDHVIHYPKKGLPIPDPGPLKEVQLELQ